MDTVVSLIPNDKHVAAAREELERAGFAESRITVLFTPAEVWKRLGGRQKVRSVFKVTLIGALIGLIVGAIYGIPAGIYNCRLMNCPLGISAILWALISLYWIVVGGFFGAIIGLDRFEEEVYSYVEGVREGEALIMVETREDQTPTAIRILQEEDGILVHGIHEEEEAR